MNAKELAFLKAVDAANESARTGATDPYDPANSIGGAYEFVMGGDELAIGQYDTVFGVPMLWLVRLEGGTWVGLVSSSQITESWLTSDGFIGVYDYNLRVNFNPRLAGEYPDEEPPMSIIEEFGAWIEVNSEIDPEAPNQVKIVDGAVDPYAPE